MPERRPPLSLRITARGATSPAEAAAVTTAGGAASPTQAAAVIAARGAASPTQAAAVIAAVTRFRQDTAAPPRATSDRQDPWRRAALLERTGRRPDGAGGWGTTHPW